MPLYYLCDNITDCDDRFDEQNCSTSENEPNVHAYYIWSSCVHILCIIEVNEAMMAMYTLDGCKNYTVKHIKKTLQFYSVVLTSPSVMTVEEGAVDGLQFCLTVTGYSNFIDRQYPVESFTIGSAKSKTTIVRGCKVQCIVYVSSYMHSCFS